MTTNTNPLNVRSRPQSGVVRHVFPHSRRSIAIAASLTVTLAVGAGFVAPTVGAAPTGFAHSATAKTAAVHNECKRSTLDVPRCGVLWGMYVQDQAYPPVEQQIGRRLDLVKNYVGWRRGQATFPNPVSRALGAGGRTLAFSWSPSNFLTRQTVSYASIAAGDWDKSVIKPEARALKAYHHRVFIDFSHEFDAAGHTALGSPAQYIAAYRHIWRVMKRAHVHNVIWTWVSTGFTLHEAQIRSYYPGPKYVDWIGYDPYNWAQCHRTTSKSPYRIFQPFYTWLRHQKGMKHKPYMLAEYGTSIDSHARSWYRHVPNALHRLPRIKAVVQWDDGIACNFRLSTSARALQGFASASHAKYILGR